MAKTCAVDVLHNSVTRSPPIPATLRFRRIRMKQKQQRTRISFQFTVILYERHDVHIFQLRTRKSEPEYTETGEKTVPNFAMYPNNTCCRIWASLFPSKLYPRYTSSSVNLLWTKCQTILNWWVDSWSQGTQDLKGSTFIESDLNM